MHSLITQILESLKSEADELLAIDSTALVDGSESYVVCRLGSGGSDGSGPIAGRCPGGMTF